MTTEQSLPPPPAPQALPPPAPVARPTSVLAIVSIVSGLLGIVGSILVVPLVASIVAVITGHLARGEIRRSQGAMDGDGLAIAGLVTGYAMIALALLLVLAVVLFFGGLAALLAFAGVASNI
jgi:hypothetical protein